MNRTLTIPLVVSIAGTTAICVAAFWLSYEALTDLADRSGVTTPWLWPLIVDGLILVATVAVVARAGRYAWGLLIAGVTVSVAGNVLHAALPDGVLPVWLRATVAAVPPIALVAVTHLAVVLRKTHVQERGDTPTVTATAPTDHRRDTESAHVSARGTGSRETATSSETIDSTALAALPREGMAQGQLHLLDAPVAPGAKAGDDAGDLRAKAVAMLSQGTPVCDIADELGVHRATIYRWRASAS